MSLLTEANVQQRYSSASYAATQYSAMKHDSLQSTTIIPDHVVAATNRRIWLPSLVYECLPYFYILAGFSALFATLYINAWYWVVPHWILFTALCLHSGLRILYRRFNYRRETGEATSAAQSNNDR